MKRNTTRFPKDFMFQVNSREVAALVSQNVIPSTRALGGSLPYAFTEQGVAMLSSVLNSDRAVRVNIAIMRAFVRVREMVSSYKDLMARIDEMEGKYDEQFQVVFTAIKKLMQPPPLPKRRIGFPASQTATSQTATKEI
jgi:ORF6N domain-containing protein